MTDENKVKKLDFSQFHFTGDHWPFTKECRSYPTNGWVHMKYAWEYRRKDQLIDPLKKLACKLFNKHDVRVMYAESDIDSEWRCITDCMWCDYRREPTEKELSYQPPDFSNARKSDDGKAL